MSEVRVKVKLNGPAVTGGQIALAQFLHFGESFQKLVRQVAEVYGRTEESLYTSTTRHDTALQIAALKAGSFVVELGLRREALALPSIDTGETVLEVLFQGLEVLVKGVSEKLQVYKIRCQTLA
jgi:hypothetical protein